jgi:hypothetical protein
VQCSSSLVLWKFWKSCPFDPEYVVSNPATQKWTVLPPTEERHHRGHIVRLGFDPSVPSCFYVFLFIEHSRIGDVLFANWKLGIQAE